MDRVGWEIKGFSFPVGKIWLVLLISTGGDYRIRGFGDGYSDWDRRFKVGPFLLIECGETTMEILPPGKGRGLKS